MGILTDNIYKKLEKYDKAMAKDREDVKKWLSKFHGLANKSDVKKVDDKIGNDEKLIS